MTEQKLYATLNALESQHDALITEKSNILSQLTDLAISGTQDVMSKTKSGEAGSTSFSYVSLTERLRILTEAEKSLGEQIKSWKEYIVASFPYQIQMRII